MMGDDVEHMEPWEARNAVHLDREAVQHAAMIRTALCVARGLTPSQACHVGCPTCGVIDASPARCEQCNGVHSAEMRGRLMAADDTEGSAE